MPVRTILRSVANRNFRLFFVGQGLSLIGTWMQQTALPYWVYSRTNSPLWLAVVSFAGQFPACLLSPFAGAVTDRVRKRPLLLLTQALSMAQAFALAALALLDRFSVGEVVTLSVLLSAVNAFDLTGRQAFLNEMIDDPEDLGNAIALNSSLFNAARLVGPSLAGLAIASLGEGTCFLLNGLSFLAVLLALSAMRLAPRPAPTHRGNVWAGLRDGAAYALGAGYIRAILLLVSLVCFLGVPYAVLIPVYVKDVLRGGPKLLGLMMAAPGVGALAGALFMASRRSVLGVFRFTPATPVLVGVGLIGLSVVDHPVAAAPLFFLIGAAVVVLLSCCNTVLQTVCAEDMRGRVIGFYATVFLGLNPTGALLAGHVADAVGVQQTMRWGGCACIIGAVLFIALLARSMARQVADLYRAKVLTRLQPAIPSGGPTELLADEGVPLNREEADPAAEAGE